MPLPTTTTGFALPDRGPYLLRREGATLFDDGRRRDCDSPELAAIYFELRVDALTALGARVVSDAATSSLLPNATGVALAVARDLAQRDPTAAALLEAEADRWYFDAPDTRAREAALLRAVAPGGSAYRAQVFSGVRGDDPPLVLDDGAVAWAWVCDDDVVGLCDGYLRDDDFARELPDLSPLERPWRINLTGRHALRGLLDLPAAARLGALHVMLFGDVAPVESLLRARTGDTRLLTHLALRTQQPDVDVARLGRRFPALRALTCDASQLSAAVADGAAQLATLVVHGGSAASIDRVLALAAGGALPALRHLAFPHAAAGRRALETLAASDTLARLETLDLFDVNGARAFDFDALLRLRPRFAHLRRIVVPAHEVWHREADFADWPEVTFANHDGREVAALHLETQGWTSEMR